MNAAVSLTGATLITLALDNLSVSAGTGGFGIAITSGSAGYLGIALVEAPTPTEAGVTDNRYWIAAVASDLSANLSIGSFASASLTGLSVSINVAGGANASGPATAFDWASEFSPEINPGTNLSAMPALNIALAAGGFSLSGSLASLSIANLINESWTGMSVPGFSLSESTVDVAFAGGGTPDLTDASLFEIGLTNISVSTGSSSFGVELSSGSLGIAVLEPAAPATGTDSRYWLAISASGLAASLTLGGAGAVSASVSNAMLAINSSGGASPSGVAASPLDWAADISVDGGQTYGSANEPVVEGQTINFATGQLSLSGSLTNLNIFNVLTSSAVNFALGSTTVGLTQSATVLSGATLITVALSLGQNQSVIAGSAGFGVSVTGGNIGIAFVEPPRPTGETDTRYWVAVDAAGLTASLNLSSSITATISNITVAINQAGGVGPGGTAAVPLNWLSSLSGTAVPVIPGAILPTGSFQGGASDTLTFNPAAGMSAATISQTGGSWITEGFLPGDQITVTGTGTNENDGTYVITSISSDGTTLTLATGSTLMMQTIGMGVSVVSSPVAIPIQFVGPRLALDRLAYQSRHRQPDHRDGQFRA